ncbi:MurR/RpiR family transcriptional regulator [Halomonas sp. ML-15]|uniref:MurR/RpiR family transcriptional regulator n=1 Tax=Halomonas sp. ML-15 TaxID=2773305 RepID=UPI0017467956|nr:MurR/RpiR family transcriptional regulator [Halomonas sp. ML-15]MBD3896372.1 MurR/RpiR family transcriptional regulator [Halomonas sp. ML-15]
MTVTKPSFVTRVRMALPNLHPTERRLAEFILEFPGELASYTASELSGLANVSNATVTRFIKKLGYRSYEEARQHVRANREEGAALLLVEGKQVDSENSLFLQHIGQGITNLQQIGASISQQQVDDVAQAMLSARRVWIIGFRSSHAFAEYLNWQILQVIEHTALLPKAAETLAESLISITAEDCVVLYGMKRRAAQLDGVIQQLERRGPRVLYITDESAPEQPGLTWHFRCRTTASGPLFNHVAVLAISHYLATRVLELSGVEGRQRLSGIEAIHEALDELQ